MAASKISQLLQDAFLTDNKSHYTFVPAQEDLNDLMASIVATTPGKRLTREAFTSLSNGNDRGLFSIKDNSNEKLAVSRFYKSGNFSLDTLIKGMSYHLGHKLSGEPIKAQQQNLRVHSIELTHNPLTEFLQFAHKIGATAVKDFSMIESHSDKFNFALKIAQCSDELNDVPLDDVSKREFQFIVMAAAVMTAVADAKPEIAATLLNEFMQLIKLDPAKSQRHFDVLATHDLDVPVSDEQINQLAALIDANDGQVFSETLELVKSMVFELEKRANPILNDYHKIQMNPSIPTTALSIASLGGQKNRDEYKQALSSVANEANYLEQIYELIGGQPTLDVILNHTKKIGFEENFVIDVVQLYQRYLEEQQVQEQIENKQNTQLSMT
ncbi:hypothetical protein ACNO5E_26285 [Vibrio parahaemolyticus]